MFTSYVAKKTIVGIQAIRQIYGSASKNTMMALIQLGQRERARSISYISRHTDTQRMLGREKNILNLAQANVMPESA